LTRRLVLYEDRHWRALRPLTDLTPVPALVFGASDLARRWLGATRAPLFSIEARQAAMAGWHHAPVPDTGSVGPDDEALVINSAALPGAWLEALLAARSPALFLGDGRIAGARLPLAMLRAGLGRGEDFETVLLSLALPALAAEASFIRYAWDLLAWNEDAIRADLSGQAPARDGDVHALAALEAPGAIRVEGGASVGAFAVLDATHGPILVGANASIAAHTVVKGPCVIGYGTELLGGVVSGSTFGPQCRIAGEVEASLWQGYANKRHHGFVGHSIVGEWVNLGALTTTSDLKNNYRSVRVNVDGVEVDSGSPKVGSLIGAHAKTGIGTLMPTGATVGPGAHLFGGGSFAPKATPAFAWWDGERMVDHDLEKFLGTARIAMSRRARTLTPAEEAACRALFASTAPERRPMTKAE
jgi:UDP-N-acetylglucosamine diphosphorylase/glucosamine-1-phosphate N-acetyltransferase